ncbi:hyaluronidase-3 isoform X1 [Thunnus albacares]|uniref:hyaluronidase-3 isoform X1 n=1 Tax=Thunnus albacares TaxID=8236 RepID=UPI001CF6BDCA|nr:hyaluronidase-3 isoform X1 [Thunnus albacares]XP_044208480.1 hyaluronidase-3 isoform X1 [Thunnus albacares]
MVLSHLPLPSVFLLFLSPLPCASSSQTSTRGHTLPAVAAAGPVLQDRPFVVVWNMPTSHCLERYNVNLDLRDFDIVANRQQSFQGQKMTIFYRDHLGKYPYLSRDGNKVNGGIPQLSDLAAHLSLAETQISGILLPDFAGLAVIDWEEWRPVWERNFGTKMEYRRLSKLLVRQESPDLSDEAVTLLARQKFEESARKFMEETMRAMVGDRPQGLWGFYGFPVCANKNKRKTDKSYTGRCHKGTREQNNRLSWLWSQSTALYPSIYLPQRLAGSMDAALMVRHRLLEALRVASLWRRGNHATPVLPYARLAFTRSLNFLNKTDLMHTLGESASLGAAGVVLWGDMKFAKSKHQCGLLRDYIRTVLGPFIWALRSDTQRCCIMRCHGNGRCARRDPSSGHMLSSPSAITSNPNDVNFLPDSSSDKAFQDHFLCQCYPGWTGPECQEKTNDENRERDV